MILALFAALAAPSADDMAVVATVKGEPVWARIDDGSIAAVYGDQTQNLEAPGKSCTALIRSAPNDQVLTRWVCGAALDRFGSVTEKRWTVSADGWVLAGAKTSKDGAEWLVSAIESAAKKDPATAHTMVAEYAGRLQYACSAEHRERVLAAMIDATAAEAEAAPAPHTGAAIVLRLLHSPPVWEAARPWDYAERLRVGAPVGNRPAPERAGWLSNTPANLARVARLAAVLHAGGQHDAAADLLERMLGLDPDNVAHLETLADIRWAQGQTEKAQALYARAKKAGSTAAQVDRRRTPE